MDLMEIDAEIEDIYQIYNYILNIIDHFSKFTGCYLLEKKTAKEVLNATNEFIIHNGNPKILQADNGLEFSNHLLDEYEYFKRKGIQLIHSSPPRPSTNGVVERVHQNIRKALLAIKTNQKKDYDIRIALINPENAQNNEENRYPKYIYDIDPKKRKNY